MKCPFCAFLDTQVKDSRPSDDGMSIKRRRQCPSCGARFTTFERVENREIKIIKKNGEVRPFDINKLIRSIEVATRKRPINSENVDEISSKILKKLEKYGEGEVPSKVVGQLVMEGLAEIDEVACVRYASVYMDFNKATDFGQFISNLRKENEKG
ncbi:MAG: transcriptional regulator NrdR [Candidatus Jidaibacter sp.]|jgi:transcriptional repressor NrdR|nr:transcriptional regulator NrdR [Candidatus Jidaibacter sp.]